MIDFINSNRLVYSKNKLLLTKQDNTQKVIPYGSLHYPDGTLRDTQYYSKCNRVADRWTDASIPIGKIKKLIFGTTQLMINTTTGMIRIPATHWRKPHSQKIEKSRTHHKKSVMKTDNFRRFGPFDNGIVTPF